MDIIQRNIDSKEYLVIRLNIKTNEVSEARYPIPGRELTQERALAVLKSKHDTEDIKLVAIKQVVKTTKLYVMSTEAFMKAAYCFNNTDELKAYQKEHKCF